MGKSSINQRPGILGNGNRTVGDQNQSNPFAGSRKGSGLSPDKHPLGSVGQKRIAGRQPKSSGGKIS